MTATPSRDQPARPNRAERRAAARGRTVRDDAGVAAPTVTGPQPRTKARGGAIAMPRRTG